MDKKKGGEEANQEEDLYQKGSAEEILLGCSKYVMGKTQSVIDIYNRTLSALVKEDRRELKTLTKESRTLYDESQEHKYNRLMHTLQSMEEKNINTGHFYVQVVDYLNELSKSLLHITQPSLQHIENHHQGLTEEQKEDLLGVNSAVEAIYTQINSMLNSGDFSQFEVAMQMCDDCFDQIADAVKQQLKRIKLAPDQNPTKVNILYLSLLNETKGLVNQSRSLLKSQNYFLSHSQQ